MPQMDKLSTFGTSQGRPRNVYQQRTRLQSMCRVCLTRSNAMMYDLQDTSALSEETYLVNRGVLNIHEALQKVTSYKVHKKYFYICIFY